MYVFSVSQVGNLIAAQRPVLLTCYKR